MLAAMRPRTHLRDYTLRCRLAGCRAPVAEESCSPRRAVSAVHRVSAHAATSLVDRGGMLPGQGAMKRSCAFRACAVRGLYVSPAHSASDARAESQRATGAQCPDTRDHTPRRL